MKHTVPSLVFKLLQLAQGYHAAQAEDDMWEKKCGKLYSLVRQVVIALAEADYPILAIKLFLQAALVASSAT